MPGASRSDTPHVLAVASRAVLAAFEALGLDGDALLAEIGLERATLADPDRRIPALLADSLWQAALARAGDPDLALHAAERLPFGAYRVIDHLAAQAPTLGHAFERIAAYFPLIDPRARVELEHESSGHVRVVMATSVLGTSLPREAAEYSFAALLLRTRAGLAFDYRPAALELAAARPSSTRELERVFACPLRFDADHHALVIDGHDWTHANERSDLGLFEVLDQHASLLLAALPPSSPFIAQVREAIAAEQREREPTLAQVGRRLGMSGRTLQRRLDEHQVRFGGLVDEVQAELAKARLADRTLAICEVAFLLGFADQSAFTRAFKRWTGTTPGRWRASVRSSNVVSA